MSAVECSCVQLRRHSQPPSGRRPTRTDLAREQEVLGRREARARREEQVGHAARPALDDRAHVGTWTTGASTAGRNETRQRERDEPRRRFTDHRITTAFDSLIDLNHGRDDRGREAIQAICGGGLTAVGARLSPLFHLKYTVTPKARSNADPAVSPPRRTAREQQHAG